MAYDRAKPMPMNPFVKLLPSAGLLVTLFMFAAASPSSAAGQAPNIVFILSDDQAWSDYGFMGNPDIKTPHLDKLGGGESRV